MKNSKNNTSTKQSSLKDYYHTRKTNVDGGGLREAPSILAGNINQIHTTIVENRTDMPQKSENIAMYFVECFLVSS